MTGNSSPIWLIVPVITTARVNAKLGDGNSTYSIYTLKRIVRCLLYQNNGVLDSYFVPIRSNQRRVILTKSRFHTIFVNIALEIHTTPSGHIPRAAGGS